MVPYLTACLIAMVTLGISFKASAEQRLVDVMFARDVVNREPVGVFEPGAYCDKEADSSRQVPVIDSETERKVVFFNRIKSSAAGILRHTWYKGDAQVGEVDLRIGVSPGWRTWSSKRIVPKAHVGNWKVVVSTVGEASEVICVAHFVVR
ncbi:MAG: DUF2914 domain-containing protein [Candidatus Binatia bacterium]